MKKCGVMFLCAGIAAAAWFGYGLVRDRTALDRGLIRMHILANSDSQEDQRLKLQVRDAVCALIEPDADALQTADQAKAYLSGRLADIEQVANRVLEGSGQRAKAELCRDVFPVREYDTFSLPSGIYETLRINIGSASGQNWWCVVYPAFCTEAIGVSARAAGAGFSQELSRSIQEGKGNIRFFFLDQLGKLSVLLH